MLEGISGRESEGAVMPTYEFECQECQKRFEMTVSVQEHDGLKKEPPPCPHCGRRHTRQLVSLFSCKVASPSF
jgi:putative FmdB family regulatory protein